MNYHPALVGLIFLLAIICCYQFHRSYPLSIVTVNVDWTCMGVQVPWGHVKETGADRPLADAHMAVSCGAKVA